MSGAMPPSYPWYPRDFLADEPVMLMSLEQEGAYRRLLDHQWLHGSIPADTRLLAAICKGITPQKMRAIWAGVAGCFESTEDGERLVNQRLERVREEYVKYREERSQAGAKGNAVRWKKHSGGIAKRSQSDDSAIANTSPSLAPSLANTTTAKAVAVDASDGGDDAFDAWRLRVPATYRDAIHAALRAAQNPDALRREFVGLEHPITGGPAYGPEVVGQAVHEMAVAGRQMGAKTLRAFCRRVGEPERVAKVPTNETPGERVLRVAAQFERDAA